MRCIALLLLCLAFVAAPLPARAKTAAADLSILVAPFEVVAPPGAPLPDVAVLLADRLGTRGLGRVVGPAGLSIPAKAEPSAADVKAWGAKAKADFVVVGRSTRLGRRVSLDLRVRSAATGNVVGTHIAEAPRPEDLGHAVDELAGDIIASAEEAAVAGAGPPAPVSAAPAGVKPVTLGSQGPEADGTGTPEASTGSAEANRNVPLSIQSQEMEARQGDDGTRHFFFRNNVRLLQGDMQVNSQRMEALYPPGSDNGPDRMIATGSVRLHQAGKRAKCEKATFYTHEKRVVCEGRDAELVQGTNRVRGHQIEFFLDTDRMIVRGGADMVLEPNATPEASATPGSAAPATPGSAAPGAAPGSAAPGAAAAPEATAARDGQ